MKNLITDFTVFVNEKYEWVSMDEQDNLSGIDAKAGIIGASKSDTTNKTAVEALKKAFDKLKSEGKESTLLNIKGEISEKNALYLNKGVLELKPKTEKKTDYIKVGDRMLNGDYPDTASLIVTYEEISRKGAEASGNGIFALGRMLKALAKGMIDRKTEIYLCLNLKNTNSFIADAKTGLQSATPSIDILMLMIGKKIIVPHKDNEIHYVKAGRNLSTNPDLLKTLMQRNAIPLVGEVGGRSTMDELRKITPSKSLDSKVAEKYAGKKLNFTESKNSKDIDEAVKIYKEISKEIYAPFMEVTAEKLKKFIDDSCKKAGVSSDLFSNVMKQIDDRVKGLISAHDKLDDKWAKDMMVEIWSPKKDGPGTPAEPGATVRTSLIKGEEGEI